MNEQIIERVPNQVAVLRHELDNMSGQFKAALPAHIPVERFCRVLMTALQQNPDLVKCSRRSLWNAAMKCAQDGLLPDGREAALIPYGDEVQYIPMIAGIRKKVRNSGEIATWDAQVVRANDEFEFELGDDPFIKHKPSLDADPGSVVAAYSIAILKSGEKSREVMSITAIEKVRGRSRMKKGGPWFTDYDEMCRKTVARRHSKVLPMSTDLDDLLRRDDDLYDMKAASDAALPDNRKKTIVGRLDALAGLPGKTEPAQIEGPAPEIDPYTGEVMDQTDPSSAPDSPPPAAGKPSSGPKQVPLVRTPGEGEPADTGIPENLKRAPKPKAAPVEDYPAHASAWIANLLDPESTRWVDEIDMRNKANLLPEVRERLKAAFEAKVEQLRGAAS